MSEFSPVDGTASSGAYLVMVTDFRYVTPTQLRRIAAKWDIDADSMSVSDLKHAIVASAYNRTSTRDPYGERCEFYRSIGSRNYLLTGQDD